MAREKKITRTIKTTVVTVMTVDTQTADVINKTVTLAGAFKNTAQILKECKIALETATLKVVEVVDIEEKVDLYAITETDFIANATKIEK